MFCTRFANISLGDCPQLITYVLDLDIKSTGCRCPTQFNCQCLSALVNTVEAFVPKGQRIRLRLVRIFTDKLGYGDSCTTSACFTTVFTVYLVDLVPLINPCELILPLTPIGAEGGSAPGHC